jgi:hypothetical protein
MGSGGLAPLILNLGTRWGEGDQLHSPTALSPVKNSVAHCVGGWVGSRAGLDIFWRGGKKALSLLGFESLTVQPRPRTVQPRHIRNIQYLLLLHCNNVYTNASYYVTVHCLS